MRMLHRFFPGMVDKIYMINYSFIFGLKWTIFKPTIMNEFSSKIIFIKDIHEKTSDSDLNRKKN